MDNAHLSFFAIVLLLDWIVAAVRSALGQNMTSALFAGLIVGLPFAATFIAAMRRDVSGARKDRAEGVLATAREMHSDLIVLGTHAQSATQAFWSASMTPKILHRAHASFLLAPAEGSPRPYG